MERVWGPLNGFYYAAYAGPVGDGDCFASYAKVCWTKPDNYWDADCAFKIFGGEHHSSAEAALISVAMAARAEIAQLPPQARTWAERRQQHHEHIPRLLVAGFFRHRLA